MEPPPIMLCMRCIRESKTHRAWSVVGGDAVCIRHVVAALALDDDMDEHWEYERLYDDLWERGYRNVY